MNTQKLDSIIVTNPYLRTDTDITSLKKSIETVGLIHPLTVNDKNELLAGGRRYQALKELGVEDVPVIRVERNQLEQELISIDENLVRTPLTKIEFEQCLNRGREIYEELNPQAIKIDVDAINLTAAEKKIEKQEEENDESSFAAVTAAKTGLSKSVIKNAIRRDAQSSDTVKEARGNGEVSASQVNEIIKLEKNDQEAVLPYIKDKPVKEVRKLVEKIRSVGLNEAIQQSIEEKSLPREFSQMEVSVKKTNKLLSKILMENIDVDHPELSRILLQVEKLQQQAEQFVEVYGNSSNDSFSYGEDSAQIQ